MFDALLLLIGDPEEIDVLDERPSLLTHAFLLAALLLLAAAMVMVGTPGVLFAGQETGPVPETQTGDNACH